VTASAVPGSVQQLHRQRAVPAKVLDAHGTQHLAERVFILVDDHKVLFGLALSPARARWVGASTPTEAATRSRKTTTKA